MDQLIKIIGLVVLGLSSIFCLVIFGTFIGGVAGWIVGLAFGETILNILGQLGVHDVTMWQFGLFMGFVGAFIRHSVNTSKADR